MTSRAPEPNSFNAIRLAASMLVLWSHCYPLTGTAKEPLRELIGITGGTLAVDIFFALSGFLIAGSLARVTSPVRFAMNRALRIYPALWVMLLGTGIVYLALGPHDTSYGAGTRLREGLQYGATNAHLLSTRLDYELPGWFESNPYPRAVNGSLWTLPWEMRMYLLLGVIGYILVRWRARAVVALALAALVIHLTARFAPSFLDVVHINLGDWSRFIWFFFCGASIQLLSVPRRVLASIAAGAVLLWLVTLTLTDAAPAYPLYAIGLPFTALWVAHQAILPRQLANAVQSHDLSYGAYLYAFPVQQAIAAGIGIRDPLLMFAIAGPVVLLLAWASWTFVESPALRLKKAVRT